MKLPLKKVELSSVTKYSLIALGAGLVFWLGLSFFSGDPKKTAAVRTDKTRCADCGLPLSKSAQDSGECPYCAMKNGGKAKKTASGSGTPGRTIPIVMISLFVVLSVIHLFVLYRKRASVVEELVFNMNCRKCDRKVRYRERQVGALATCPGCRCMIRFPEAPEKAKGRWGIVKSWFVLSHKKKVEKDSAT